MYQPRQVPLRPASSSYETESRWTGRSNVSPSRRPSPSRSPSHGSSKRPGLDISPGSAVNLPGRDPRVGAWNYSGQADRRATAATSPVMTPLTGGGGQQSPNSRMTREQWYALYHEFYSIHNRAKLADLPMLMDRFRGEEERMWRPLLAKYNVTEQTWRLGHPPAPA
eukprot:Hpha_TRINITY_DN20726_c0_g1::TRINITY_DN20726_c0_g1_i1::g.33414::m.33414